MGVATLLFLASLAVSCVRALPTNLSNGQSCVYGTNCASGCCDFGYNSESVLGSYCFAMDYCTSALKTPGQSCGVSNECESKCCEQTICQASTVCFNKYVLPFVIVFGAFFLFIVAAVVVFVFYKRKVRREKMLKALEQKAKSMLTLQKKKSREERADFEKTEANNKTDAALVSANDGKRQDPSSRKLGPSDDEDYHSGEEIGDFDLPKH